MLRRPLAGRMRRISTWLLGGVVALVGVFTVQQAASIADESRREHIARSNQELSTLVALWEGLITDRIRAWNAELGSATSFHREAQLRTTVAWFDASYQWTTNGNLTWPRPAERASIAVQLDHPCLSKANSLRVMGQAEDAAAAFEACSVPTPNHALAASYLAAKVRIDAKQYRNALEGLVAAKPALETSLTKGADDGLDVSLLVQRRSQAIEAMEQLGMVERRAKLTSSTIAAITELPAADLEVHLKLAESLLLTLSESSADTEELRRLVQRATRRLLAFDALQSRLIGESRTAVPGELQIVQDLYSEPGFLLVWTALDARRRFAVQVDASALLESLKRTLPPSTGVYIVDGRGFRVSTDGKIHTDEAPIPLAASVSLGRILPHLSVATTSLEESQGVAIERVLLPLAPLGVSLVLGLLAVWAQTTASRREQDLHHRQQQFITRVTHELKTPLAGIRVMAETLQLGAAEDPKTRDQFLDRILNECNNLSTRIDEVLSAARKPQIKDIVETSTNELVQSIITRWEPRFTQADATLEAHLGATPTISVDLELFRDAVGNLLDNALKYRRPGIPGICRVRTGTIGRWVIVEVSDNGIGIPADKRRAVFERFTRVEGPGRGKAGGHGLGLSFVADTAAAHAGLVECLEGIDGGACFRIKLPRR